MDSIKWTVQVSGNVYSGETALEPGKIHIGCEAGEGVIEKVIAHVLVPMDNDERIFLNGFQTWTHSPEYSKKDRQKGTGHIPRFIVRKYDLDHFGDYHFEDYPATPGKFHGFSWSYIRKGENFRLIGSLDEEPGYTIFRYDCETAVMTIERDCKGVHHPGGQLDAFGLYFAQGPEDEVFDGWFKAMKPKCVVGKPIKGYSSWYNRYEDISEQTVLDDLAGCRMLFEKGDLFQIDDGWETAVGDWTSVDAKKFPSGMKAMADAAHNAGFKAGLWLAPFVCEKDSDIFREHQDWLFKVDGKPWSDGPNWSSFYSLDIDNPEVVKYLEGVFDKVVNEWGYDLLKLDFLYGAAPFGTSSESRGGRMIRAMKMLRKWCGNALILGCGVPVMPAFGCVDYCRVGCDVSLEPDGIWYMKKLHSERPSTRNAIDNAVYRRQLNGRAYGSDPDVFFLRDDNIKLSNKDKRTLGICAALFGDVFLTSDNPGNYTTTAREQYQEILELREAKDIHVKPKSMHKWVVEYMLDGKKRKLKLQTP